MNLFWKIFITFGVAMTLTLVGAVFVSFSLAGLAFDQTNIENREVIIERAAAELAQGGEDGLRTWLARNPSPTPGIVLLILDPQGEDLLGRPLPQRFEQLLRSRSFRPHSAPSNFRPPQFTSNLVAPDGSEYRLLFDRTRVTVLGGVTWPATQVAVLTLSILAAAATSLLLARYLSSPIVRLQRASRSLAAGALETRVGGPFNRRKDEVGILARDFDAMAERIQALVNDKDTLLRDVSHELRSPLARLRVALALAQRKANDASQSDLDRIEQETERLDALVGQILMLARLRSPLAGRHEMLELDELVEEVVSDARFEYPDVELTLETTELPKVYGDRVELTSAIENVIRNALLHAGASGPVRVTVKARNREIEICVSDRGPGVAPEDLQRIFEPFYRVDPSRDHQRGGYGLGLAIAASVVARHKGTARARNGADGGLEVILTLPIGAAKAAQRL
ncbi:MAG TPA: ATP-binding protein [Gammaproteobacteria bacterium]